MTSLGCIRRLLGCTFEWNNNIIEKEKKKKSSYIHGILVPASKLQSYSSTSAAIVKHVLDHLTIKKKKKCYR